MKAGKISAGVVDPTPEALASVHRLLPDAVPPDLPDGPLPAPVTVETEHVIDAMRSFKKGSACGRDGFWPQYSVDILSCPCLAGCAYLVAIANPNPTLSSPRC